MLMPSDDIVRDKQSSLKGYPFSFPKELRDEIDSVTAVLTVTPLSNMV
jgi:hypothetical protein